VARRLHWTLCILFKTAIFAKAASLENRAPGTGRAARSDAVLLDPMIRTFALCTFTERRSEGSPQLIWS
jgi:hypothetical protein